MYTALTPRWANLIFACVAGLLAIVPFVAFYKGPQIRARSPLSKMLMAEEQRMIAEERGEGRESGEKGGEKGVSDGEKG